MGRDASRQRRLICSRLSLDAVSLLQLTVVGDKNDDAVDLERLEANYNVPDAVLFTVFPLRVPINFDVASWSLQGPA